MAPAKRDAHPRPGAWHRSEVEDADDRVPVLVFPEEGENAALPVAALQPFVSALLGVELVERGLSPIEVTEFANQFQNTPMRFVVE